MSEVVSRISINFVYLRASGVFFDGCSSTLACLSRERDWLLPGGPMLFGEAEQESLVRAAQYTQTLADMARWIVATTETQVAECAAGWGPAQAGSDLAALAAREAPPEKPGFTLSELGPPPQLADLLEHARELFSAGFVALKRAGDSGSLRAVVRHAEVLDAWLAGTALENR